MKLYEYPQALANILELLETEEFAESAEVKNALDTLELDFKAKVENVAHKMNELKGDAEAIKTEMLRLNDIKLKKEAQAEWLKNYLKDTLTALAEPDKGFKLETKLFKFTISKPTLNRLVIDDEAGVPKKLLIKEIKIKPDTRQIKELLKAGRKVKGCHLESGRSFTIK